MTMEIKLSDRLSGAAIVADLIQALANGTPPNRWEHDIAYNYLVDQGAVADLAIQAFPYLVAVLEEPLLKAKVRESLVHLCAVIFPKTQKRNEDRLTLVSHISDLM